MEQYMPFIWIGLAVVLAVLEISTTQLVSIWFVVGALAAAVTTVFTDSLLIQVIVFVLISAICLVVTRPFVKKVLKTKQINTNADSLIGKTGIITIEVDNTLAQGQISVNGQIWSARCEDDSSVLKVGQKAKVKSISGVKLILTPAENS